MEKQGILATHLRRIILERAREAEQEDVSKSKQNTDYLNELTKRLYRSIEGAR